MNSIEMKDELRAVSLKENITQEQLKELIYLVVKFVRDKIKSADRTKGYFPAIRVKGLGIFHVTQARQNKLNKKRYDDKYNN